MKLHKTTDRIEKEIVLRAPRSRVWRALADAEQFGAWFGMKLEGAFAPGARVRGQMTSPAHELVTIEFAIEPTTLVEFQLEEVAGGTQLRVVESGFDRIPLARRAEAFRMNDAGWAEQLENIARYVAK
jgi:uncharacterized protein YndB with AHSA1/START domain